MKRVHSLFLILGWAVLALAVPAAKSNLDTDTNVFSAVVPGTCTITNGTQTVTMTYTSGNSTLTGETSNITINANGPVRVSLSQITATAEAKAAAAATADINDKTDSQDGILDTAASESSASSTSLLGNATDANHLVTIVLTATGVDTPGTYTYQVTLNCLQ